MLPSLSQEQRMINNTKALSSVPPPSSLLSHKQGKIDNAEAPLPLPSCVLQLLTLLRKRREINIVEVPLLLPSHALLPLSSFHKQGTTNNVKAPRHHHC
jgi:hypothetical protein